MWGFVSITLDGDAVEGDPLAGSAMSTAHLGRECLMPVTHLPSSAEWEGQATGKRPNVAADELAAEDDWSRSTREFVGHGLNFKMPYLKEKWLVDSASTCMVANEPFKEFSNVGPAAVTITVGGDHRPQCSRVGDLTIATGVGPITLQEVRIVPGFGVNILSGPYLEKRLGLTLSSDGRFWWAKRRGRQVLKGEADDTGLYWVTVARLAVDKRIVRSQLGASEGSTSKYATMGSKAPQIETNNGGSRGKLANSPAPLDNGRSPTIRSNVSFLPHPSRIADLTDSHSEESGATSVDEGMVAK